MSAFARCGWPHAGGGGPNGRKPGSAMATGPSERESDVMTGSLIAIVHADAVQAERLRRGRRR